MTDLRELNTSSETAIEAAVTDRRRPGRRPKVSPELIPILRNQEAASTFDEQLMFDEMDQMAGVRGITVGVMLSAPMWVGIAFLGRWLLS